MISKMTNCRNGGVYDNKRTQEHTSRGEDRPQTDGTVAQTCRGSQTAAMVAAVERSPRAGTSRKAAANPITNAVTASSPTTPDENQIHHMLKNDAVQGRETLGRQCLLQP